MSIIEKILIAILVVLLPIGVFVTHYVLTNDTSADEEVIIDAEKLKMMVDKYGKMEKEASNLKKQFVVSSVSYASESGSLSIKGVAPSSLMTVMMSATVLSSEDLEGEDSVLGLLVGNYSVLVKKDGKFLADLPIKNSSGIVEVRLEQDDVVRTVRYDFNKKLQTL